MGMPWQIKVCLNYASLPDTWGDSVWQRGRDRENHREVDKGIQYIKGKERFGDDLLVLRTLTKNARKIQNYRQRHILLLKWFRCEVFTAQFLRELPVHCAKWWFIFTFTLVWQVQSLRVYNTSGQFQLCSYTLAKWRFHTLLKSHQKIHSTSQHAEPWCNPIDCRRISVGDG